MGFVRTRVGRRWYVALVIRSVATATAAFNENLQARSVTLQRLDAKLNKHWRSVRTTLEHVTSPVTQPQKRCALAARSSSFWTERGWHSN
jgi:hypothetical protein